MFLLCSLRQAISNTLPWRWINYVTSPEKRSTTGNRPEVTTETYFPNKMLRCFSRPLRSLRENIHMLDFSPHFLNRQILTNLGSRHIHAQTAHTSARKYIIPSVIGQPPYSPSTTIYRLKTTTKRRAETEGQHWNTVIDAIFGQMLALQHSQSCHSHHVSTGQCSQSCCSQHMSTVQPSQPCYS